MIYTELASGGSAARDRHDSRGSRGESDDDSTDLDDETYHEVTADTFSYHLNHSFYRYCHYSFLVVASLMFDHGLLLRSFR